MRMKTTMNCGKLLRRLLTLCLFLAMTAGCACAENILEMRNESIAWLHYECTLPDGRMLLAGGTQQEPGSDKTGEWLVCLNRDRTVSWEYTAPPADEYSEGCSGAALMEDGTIAVLLEEAPHDGKGTAFTVQFFTQDGKPAGKKTALPAELMSVYQADRSGVMLTGSSNMGAGTEVVDWNGNKTAQYEGYVMPGGWGGRIPGDGYVLYGQRNGRAVIMKTDGPQGVTLWETALDYKWPDTGEAQLFDAVKTTDGGYAALLYEIKAGTGQTTYERRTALVKLDQEGQVQWIKKNSDEDNTRYTLSAYNGKLVMYPKEPTAMDTPQSLRWFDEKGNELGTTELTVKPEECAGVTNRPVPENVTAQEPPKTSPLTMIPMEDGLWALTLGFINGDAGNGYNETVCMEPILIRVPEL